MLLQELITKFEQKIPLALQESWDKCGLQVGSRTQKIARVLFAYDCCHEVIKHAIKNKIDLIVTHHPIHLKDYKSIDLDNYEGQMIREAIKHDIAIYTAHTNHDASEFSLNHYYAKQLGLIEIQTLAPISNKPYVKLVVFVPSSHTESVSEALFEAGAGHIGHYDSCSFRSEGIGTFKGDDGTQPFLGKPGKLEQAVEDRLETIVPKNRIHTVVKALLAAHPYEEVAYDLYPLENTAYLSGRLSASGASGPATSPRASDTSGSRSTDCGAGSGHGSVGNLPKAIAIENFLKSVKKVWGLPNFRWVGKPKQMIRRVGMVTGSGMSYLNEALKEKCDVFITGDVKYHQAIDSLRHNLALIDPGHFYSEKASVEILSQIFQELFGKSLNTSIYTKLVDPFQIYS